LTRFPDANRSAAFEKRSKRTIPFHFAGSRPSQELCACQNVALQQTEQDIMAEDTLDRRTTERREPTNDSHSVTPPSQQNGPSPFNDGPELIRDNHC